MAKKATNTEKTEFDDHPGEGSRHTMRADPPKREITIINKSPESGPPKFLDHVEKWSKVASIVAVPIVLAVVGCWFDTRLKIREANQVERQHDQTVGQKYVEVAVGILQQKEGVQNPKQQEGLRKWAVALVNHYSPTDTKLSEDLKAGLVDGSIYFDTNASHDAITGPDDRQAVQEVSEAPYPSIVHLRVLVGEKDTKREFFATGFLVHPNLVLTTGYHVYSFKDDVDYVGSPKEIQVFLGMSYKRRGGGEGHYEERIIVSDKNRFLVDERYAKYQDTDFNLGGILIQREQPSREYLATSRSDKTLVNRFVFHISGYPRDVAEFPEIWEASGKIAYFTENRFNYAIDTGQASSGAPIWIHGSDGEPVAIGMHTGSIKKRGIAFGDEHMKLITKWKKAADVFQKNPGNWQGIK